MTSEAPSRNQCTYSVVRPIPYYSLRPDVARSNYTRFRVCARSRLFLAIRHEASPSLLVETLTVASCPTADAEWARCRRSLTLTKRNTGAQNQILTRPTSSTPGTTTNLGSVPTMRRSMWLVGTQSSASSSLSVSARHLPASFGHYIIHLCAIGERALVYGLRNPYIPTGRCCLLEK